MKRVITAVALLLLGGQGAFAADVSLLNVSYDPTRELVRRVQQGVRRTMEG